MLGSLCHQHSDAAVAQVDFFEHVAEAATVHDALAFVHHLNLVDLPHVHGFIRRGLLAGRSRRRALPAVVSSMAEMAAASAVPARRAEKSGNIFRVGIFLAFLLSPAHPHVRPMCR